jgi:hypothetical protein
VDEYHLEECIADSMAGLLCLVLEDADALMLSKGSGVVVATAVKDGVPHTAHGDDIGMVLAMLSGKLLAHDHDHQDDVVVEIELPPFVPQTTESWIGEQRSRSDREQDDAQAN